MSPDKSKVIVGGAFQNISGQPAYGLAALDATTGALLPFDAANSVRNAGANAAIVSLTADANAIYGTGYVFGAGGNLEGTFSANPDTGAINWIEDCHGDTYSAFASLNGVYTVSHAHYCGNVGGFPQTDPWSINQRFALAFTKEATGTVGRDPLRLLQLGRATPAPRCCSGTRTSTPAPSPARTRPAGPSRATTTTSSSAASSPA